MKKVLILALALFMTLGLFAGCGSDDTQSAGSDTASGSGDISTAKVIYKNEDGSAVYRIVRPDKGSNVSSLTVTIIRGMKETVGVSIKNVSDAEDGTDMYEILIGNTNRSESAQALEILKNSGMGRYMDYIICTIGKKIVINGMTDEAISEAVNYFVENFIKADCVDGGINYKYATPGEFKDITVNGVGIYKFQLVRDLSNRSWLIQEEVAKIQEYVKEQTGFIMPLLNDKETDEAEYEINIGNTTRTTKPSSDFGMEDWEISVQDKKVYIAGGSTYAIQVAVTEFGKMVQKGAVTNADSTTGVYSQTIANYDSETYYRVTWAEEFNYDGELDLTKWTVMMANKHELATQVLDETTSSVENGLLIMRGFKNDDGTYFHHPSVQTGNNMRYNFGYLELRARIPDGKGIYSSFWTTGDGLELDIFESLGVAHNQQCNIHYWGSLAPDDEDHHTSLDGIVSNTERRYYHENGSLFDDFRTVGMYWTAEEIKFIYDGQVYYYEPGDDRWIDKYLALSIGFNIGWDGRTPPSDDTVYPVEYHADYVRLYQVDGQGLKSKW